MKITVIHGAVHHGSTYNCAQILLQEIQKIENAQVSEFFLPKDMPAFCAGCYSCFFQGEDKCPHAEYTIPIIDVMLQADVILLTSPVYALDVSGAMKAFLDHLCFMWISHRPNPRMFNKVGVAMCTTAGAGLSHTAKTMKNSLDFWCMKRVFTYKKAVAASKWEEVSEKKQVKIQRQLRKLALKLVKNSKKIERLSLRPVQKLMFGAMRGMMKNNGWNERDRGHWEQHNYFKKV